MQLGGPTAVRFSLSCHPASLDIWHRCFLQAHAASSHRLPQPAPTSTCRAPSLCEQALDDALAVHFAAQFRAQSGEDALAQPRAAVRLRQACERLRRTLSANSQSSVAIDCLVGEAGLQCSLTRTELEALAQPLLARVGAACEQAMSDSGLRPGDLHAVELVGGFSRMPALHGVLQEVRSPPTLAA